MLQRTKILKILIGVIIIAVGVFLGIMFDLPGKISIQAVQNYIEAYGHFSALIYIILFSLRTFLVIFPYSIMVILGGSIFGAAKAFIYSLISAFISATLAFYFSRVAGKSFVQKLLKGKMQELDLKIEKHGFKIILLMRVSIIFPFDILNFAAGLSKVRYRDFILATMLGIIPETFSLTYLGSSLDNPFSGEFYLAVIMVFLTVTIPFIVSKIKKKKSS